MKTVKALFEHLSLYKKFNERYPGYDPDDGKIHILYLSPCLNESGYYRMILPALELNRTDTHCAIIAHIHKWDFHKLFDDYDNPVDFHLVQWADYVVVPALFSDAGYFIQAMRKINPDIEFVMDIDINYHQLPEYHPEAKRLTQEVKDTLLDNLSLVDMLTAPNSLIISHYNYLAEKSDREFAYYATHFPNLISNFTYEEFPQILRNSGDKIRVGLLLDASLPEDLQTIEGPLKELIEKNKDKMELIIYGWSEKISKRSQVLQDVSVKYEHVVYPISYPVKLNELTLDIGLIPYADHPFNYSGRAYNRFLDFSGLMIPCVVPAMPPFKKIITEGENGFVAASSQEWVEKTNKLIADAKLRTEIGQAAFKLVWENLSYTNSRALKRLQEIFA